MSGSEHGTFVLWLAGPGDLARVLAADVFDGPAKADWTARFLGVAAPDPRSILVLAELDGAVVGFATGAVMDHPDKAPQLFLQELGVTEAAQRRGIGRALVARIRAEGRARGCTVTWVLTEDDNTPARATYRAAGGEETTGVVMFEWDEGEAE
jgi:ribosomal protein S18 acetylase RimI-like enzyme